MPSDFGPELYQELRDDFFAESDELLTAIRQDLLRLEEEGSTAPTEDIFRSMHTLKGICAMAGVPQAEELAHHAEDLLRAVVQGRRAPIESERELLHAAATQLERIISADRRGEAMPREETLLQALKAGAGTASSPAAALASAADDRPPSEQAPLTTGRDRWRCTYTPSREREQRGINVDVIRSRLSTLGEILAAEPKFQGGAMTFVFVVALREVPRDLPAWEADGVQFERLEPEATELEGAAALTPSHIVRVDLERLDDLMRLAGQLVIQRSRLDALIAREYAEHEGLREVAQGLARSLRSLRKAVSRVRLVPIAELFRRMPFVVRDLMAHDRKRARVVIEGQQTEIDKYVAERIREPLLHLVRNAYSHAIESPEERRDAGKPEEGRITLRAVAAGQSVLITIADDGRGIVANDVAARARRLGLPVPEQIDSSALVTILCSPGFSTRDQADRAAGRGMGMSVVAQTVRELGGSVSLRTEPGKGSEFSLRLPLTLSIIDVVTVRVGDQTSAVPESGIDEIFQPAAREVRAIRDTLAVPYRGGLLPLVYLRRWFQMESTANDPLTVIVYHSDQGALGLVVDRVQSRHEVVVRSVDDPLVHVPGVLGATELGDGRPILILDPAAMTRGVFRPVASSDPHPAGT